MTIHRYARVHVSDSFLALSSCQENQRRRQEITVLVQEKVPPKNTYLLTYFLYFGLRLDYS